MKKHIYVIRHGETEYNRLRIVQGSGVNTSLNETGKVQAQAFYDQYQDYPFEVVLTSKLKRTHETVTPFLEKGLPWEQFTELDEMSWGDHEGKKSTPAMEADYKRINAAWDSGNFDVGINNGETITQLAARCDVFKMELMQREGQHILVCAHGRLIRCLMCVLLDKPLKEMKTFGHSNTGLYQLTYEDGEFELVSSNDTSHLEMQPVTIKNL